MYCFDIDLKKLNKIFNKNKKNINLGIGEKKNYKNRYLIKNKKIFSIYPKYNTEKELLESIKKWILYSYKVKVSINNIATSLGNKESLFSITNYFNNKKLKYIAFKKPFYPFYNYLTKFLKKKPIYFNNIKEINKIKKKINFIIISNPDNPTGYIYKKKEIKEIINITKNSKIIIVSDECYSDIIFKKFYSFSKYVKKKKNIFCINSLSKRSCAPGLRSGYVLSNKKYIKKLKIAQKINGSTLPTYTQKISKKLWNDRKEYKKIFKKKKKKVIFFCSYLKKKKIKFKKPKGTFYIWINIKKTKKKSKDFCKYLYKKYSIITVPGIFLGKEFYIRVALVENNKKCKKSIYRICKTILKFMKKFKNKKKIFREIKKLNNGKERICLYKKKKWTYDKKMKENILNYLSIKKKKMKKNNTNIHYDVFENRFLRKKNELKKKNIRITYLSFARYGSYISKNVIMLPCFVNIGAYISKNCLLDSWCTVGSCAFIGKNVHISGGAGIGGVLEPINSRPVIIEDNCFIGARSEIVEGVIIGKNSVISMGVYIGRSTKIYDRTKKKFYFSYIPKNSVVVPGSLNYGLYSLYAVIIVKKKDKITEKKIKINKKLRKLKKC